MNGLPASLEAIKAEAEAMFSQIDRQKARCFVQQMTNGHGDEDTFAVTDEGPVSYSKRRADLEAKRENLTRALPPAVIDSLNQKDHA